MHLIFVCSTALCSSLVDAGALPGTSVKLCLGLAGQVSLGGNTSLVGVLATLAVTEVDGIALDVANADHGGTKAGADLHEDLRVVVVGGGPNNGLGTSLGVLGLEDAGTDEDTVHTELHHEGSICGGGDTTGGEVDNGELAVLGNVLDELCCCDKREYNNDGSSCENTCLVSSAIVYS